MSEWQPVKGGVIDYAGAILTYAPRPRGEPKSNGYVWRAWHGGKKAPVPPNVTHWQPLPEPPE